MSQFTSFAFVLFVLALWSAYRLLPHRGQNVLLLLASYGFYASWDWRFSGLILFSTVVDYVAGRVIGGATSERRRRAAVSVSIGANLGLLGFFKYFDFFVETLADLFGSFGLSPPLAVLHVVLPVGISFYTFQTLSYTIDVYRGQLKPVRSFIDFALYVAFFPQLVAGPIERAARFMPQIVTRRRVSFERVAEGCALIVYGYFLKLVVADNCALVANAAFGSAERIPAAVAWLGTYAFAFQIFGDFAGYTNIARGIAACFGFELVLNFDAPYMAATPSEFWRRWHISLSEWLRDYLYVPLGGDRGTLARTARNLAITMLLGGLWHGAAWTFVAWGAYHGALLVIYRFAVKRPFEARSRGERLAMRVLFFHLVCFGWILFRADSIPQALSFMSSLVHFGGSIDELRFLDDVIRCGPWILVVTVIQALQYRGRPLVFLDWSLPQRVAFYSSLFYAVVIFGVSDAQTFIYFQF